MQFFKREVSTGKTWLIVGLALLAIGILMRAALYFPLAMYQLDSDAVIAGLCGFRVMGGQHPVFLPGGVRVGAASCYLAAAYFHFVGPNRVGLALTGLTWGVLYLVFSWLFLQATLGRRLAPIAFLFGVVPAEQFMTVTYAPWGYGEIMTSCAAMLWLASAWRSQAAAWQRFFFGLSVGIGFWFSLQTLMIAIPAIVWIAMRRRGTFLAESTVAIPGVVVGALPFLVANVGHGFPTLTQNSYSQTVSSLPQALANFVWLLTNLIPKLLFRFPISPDWPILLGAFAVVAAGFVMALNRDALTSAGSDISESLDQLDSTAQLLALVFLACVVIFSFSAAGTIRGWTVRYVAPLYVVVPAFYGIGVVGLWRWSKALAALTIAALLIPNLLSYGLPGSKLRADLTTQLADDRKLREVFAQRHVRAVYGRYLWVYHLNFDSREQIAGVSSEEAYDYYRYGERLGSSPVRWALLGGFDEVSTWRRAAGAKGTLIKSGDLWLFVANRPARSAAALFAALRK